MSRIILPTILVGETKNITFDFTSLLANGETITSASVTATVYSGTDPLPSGIISGVPTISGSTVVQKITAGQPGVTYLVNCTIYTSALEYLSLTGYMPVKASNF